MAIARSVTSPISRALPKATNMTGAAISGIGAYKVGRFLDGLIGNKIQSIGVTMPFVGRLSLLDALLVLSFKSAYRKNSMVAAAFAGDKIFNLGSSFLGLGTSSGPTVASSPKTGTAQGGGF